MASRCAIALVAVLAVLGTANAQVLETSCPPKSGDVYYLGHLGSVSSWIASWIAAEHAVNANGLAAKPSIGCFDFELSFFPDGTVASDELICTDDPDYPFRGDIENTSSKLKLPFDDCENFCVPVNANRYSTACTAANGEPGAMAVTADDKVLGVVGASCSGPSVEAATYLGSMGIPQVSPSSTSGTLSDVERFPTFFRTAAGDDGQSMALLELAVSFGIQSAGVIGTRDAFSGKFAETIARFGPEVGIDIKALELVCEDTDCSESYDEVYDALQRIKDTGVKVVFLTQHCQNGLMAYEIMYELGMTSENCYQIISGDPAANDDCWNQLEAPDTPGRPYDFNTFVPLESSLGFAGAMPRGGSGDIYKDFMGFWAEQDKCNFPGKIHNEGVLEVEMFAPEAYDATLAFAMAIKKLRNVGKEVTRASIVETLDEPGFTFQGATGIVTFGGEYTPPIGDHDRPPVYDLVAFEGKWLTIGYWSPIDIETITIFMPMIFPTAVFEPPECLQQP